MAAHESVSKKQFNSLTDVAASGHITDEWDEWQQGRCGTYACALQSMRPDLKLGVLDNGNHFFAHDDRHAYDSSGKHPLPYRGVEGNAETVTLNSSASEWGLPHEEAGPEGPASHLAAAVDHARRHGILGNSKGRGPK